MSDTFDRSQLDGKDREQLSEIASALGVKAISRMRKADLVDAIVRRATRANGGDRQRRQGAPDPLDAPRERRPRLARRRAGRARRGANAGRRAWR